MLQEAADSVHLLISPYARGTANYLGGGVWVTAFHCVDDIEEGQIILCHNPTTGRSHLCTVWRSNPSVDMALLTSTTQHVLSKPIKVGKRDAELGDRVFNIGYGEGLHKDPIKLERRIYGGEVVGFYGIVGLDSNCWYVHESAAISGDSGGVSLIIVDGEAVVCGILWGSNESRDISVCGQLRYLLELMRR